MPTILDLAVEYDLSPKAVEQWMRKRGYGRPKGNLSAKIEDAFRKAHDGDRPLAQLLTAPPRGPVVPTPVINPTTRVDNPSISNHYQRKYTDLLDKHREALAERDAARAELDPLRQTLERLEARAAEPQPPRAEPSPTGSTAGSTLRDALALTGLFDAELRAGLRALIEDDARCDALLDAARVTDVDSFTALAPICPHPTCRALAAAERRVAVTVTASRCDVCRNSDNRRAWREMAHACVVAMRTRILIVGGADDTHAEVAKLAALTPKLDVGVIDGTSRQTRQRARTKVRHADVVALWTQLDHKVSDVYKSEADAQPGALRVAVREGGRGVKALAEAITEAVRR